MTESLLFFGCSGAAGSSEKLDNCRDNDQVSVFGSNDGGDIARFFHSQ